MPPLFTIDTIVHLLCSTVLHPFPAILTLLSVVALGHQTSSQTFRFAVIYCALVAILYLLQKLDSRIASGPPRKIDWEDEVVVITGGAGGLGGLIALTYGMRGVPVAILDKKNLNTQEVEEWEEKGVSYYHCDVGNRRNVEIAAKAIEEDLGTPTILINNAAVVNGKQFLDLTEEDIQRTYNVNVLSHYYTIQRFLPGMLLRPNGGTIVTVSSVLGSLGCAGLSDYTSSKSSLKTLHQSLHAELTQLSTHPPTQPTQFPQTLPANPNQNRPTSTPTTRNPTHQQQQQIHPQAIRLILLTPGQLSTPLFSRITPPSTFFGPTVSVTELAAQTVAAVDAGVHAEIAAPLYARWIDVLGVLPPGLRAVARAWARLDAAGWEGCVLRSGEGGVGGDDRFGGAVDGRVGGGEGKAVAGVRRRRGD